MIFIALGVITKVKMSIKLLHDDLRLTKKNLSMAPIISIAIIIWLLLIRFLPTVRLSGFVIELF